MQKIVFIDRDGVICENHDDYVKSWPEFSFLPNSLEALAKLTQAGYRIIVVTNQSAVGRGLLDLETLHDIHSRMIAIVEQHGGRIERVMVCPHRPEDKCRCRKPQPGMLLTAAQELGLDLTSAFMIGDACTDVQAGQAAGCRSFLVLTGRGLSQLAMTMHQAKTNFHVVPGLDIAVEHILNNEETVTLSFTPMILPVS